jgi:hypothetical protein
MSVATLTVGTRLRNNDPRVPDTDPYKIVTVLGVGPINGEVVASYQARTRLAHIKLSRIFDDGKNRHQGYNVVS